MSNKRKREEEEIEFLPSSKTPKPASDEVTRSGRVRKKPARFQDVNLDIEEDEVEAVDNTKTAPSKSTVVLTTTPPKMVTIPVPVSPTVVTKIVSTPVSEVTHQPVTKTSPQTTKTLLQAKLMEIQKLPVIPPMPPPSHGSPATSKFVPVQLSPQPVQLPTLLVKTALQANTDVFTLAENSDTTPKSGRVRKKSAKVLEMEAFEEAERAKHNVKKGGVKPVTSPPTTPPKLTKLKPEDVQQRLIIQKTLPVASVTSPLKAEPMEQMLNTVTVQQALLQLPVMKPDITPSKNSQETLNQTSSAKKPKKKKVDVSAVSDISPLPQTPVATKVTKTTTKSGDITIAGLRSDVDPMLSTSLFSDSSAHLMVKEEPGDGVDLGLISSETHGINMSAIQPAIKKQSVVKPEPVTQVKKTKSKSKKSVAADPALVQTRLPPDVTVQDEVGNKASSVIKMLLSKPSQYTSPAVSTKTITTNKKSKQQKVALDTELSVDTVVKEEPAYMTQGLNNDSELKSKLMLSPTDMDDDLSYEAEEMYAKEDMSPESTGKKKVKKIKKKPKPKQDIEDDSIDGSVDWEFETADGNLVIAETIAKNKLKKSPKKSKPGSGGSEAYMDDTQTGYAHSKKGKVKSPPASTEKKKKRLTAYTMWCNTVRNKVLNDNPGIDFAQLSRRLGEIWQGLPSKDKMNWKRKAKREARKLMGKGLLITTGKGGSGGGPLAVSQVHSKPPNTASSNVQHTFTQQQQQQQAVSKVLTFTKPDDSQLSSPSKSGLGNEPVDVAAHLKLLGESLSIIGMRLQEHRGLIAVQGSLSVLLDSMLCAVGPLMCLTSQVSEMNGCPADTHARILDHIAYIMPGL